MADLSRMVDKNVMKRYNARLVFDKIYEHRAVSRPQLAQLTGLTVMSTGRIADELIETGLVCDAEASEELSQGRPPKRVQVNREQLLSLGVSLERNGFRLGAIDPYGRIVRSAFVPLKMRGSDPGEAVGWLANAITAFRAECPFPLLPVLGISVTGFVDPGEGCVRFSSQFQWNNVPLAAMLGEKLIGLDIVVDNDIKAWALAEKRFGATQLYENSVMLNIGSGIGAAAVIGGVVYRGQDNTAGEIGHIVINPAARLCECGKMGCLQTYLTDWAILQEARSAFPEAALDDVFSGYAAGVPWARALIGRVVQYACIAINLLVNTYAPGAVVICGSLIERYPVLWDAIQAEYKSHLTDFTGSLLAFSHSSFGMDCGMIGASAVAFEHMLDRLIT